MRRILGYMRKASERFHMIEPGDKIAIGVSGGKDSMLLAYAFSLYRRYIGVDFSAVAITVDLGFEGFDTPAIADYIRSLDIPYFVEKTEIGKIVFDYRKEKNPCALCAQLRKGAFYTAAKREGCNKAAFAHHADDLIETLLMSLFYESRINTFSPITYLTRRDITLTRPFIFLAERDVVGAVRRHNVPSVTNPCPAGGLTKREEIKDLIRQLTQVNPHVKKNMLAAISNTETYNLWDKLSLKETTQSDE